MEYNYDNKMLSMPEQVNKNTADIAELKKVTNTPAVMYNASVEIATDAGVVSQSDVIETVITTDNSYIMDTVGSLFKIISIVDSNIFILYVSNIRGTQGEQGEQGEPGTPINPYPVNSIYLSIVDTNPSLLFGGTWEQLKDKFLLGAGDVYVNGATGGEASHTLTVNEMPSHSHKVCSNSAQGSSDVISITSVNAGSDNNASMYNTSSTGAGQAHNNMPPYLVVYMWKRVA